MKPGPAARGGAARRPSVRNSEQGMVDPDTVRDVLGGLDGEWQPAVLVQLANGPRRSADLRRAVSPSCDWRSFINTVNRLQAKGLIDRRAGPMHNNTTRPGAGRITGTVDLQEPESLRLQGEGARERVTYELTDIGRSVLSLLADVDAWARNHPDHADRIRRRK
jgi:DNA-binding HxlR family transcriptional regulator